MSRTPRRALLRAAALAPLAALAACETIGDLFETTKATLPGKREAVLGDTGTITADPSERRPVVLPPAVTNVDWALAGGVPGHVVGNIAVDPSRLAWRRDIGEGGGYRRKITATPVIAGGRVFTMDSNGGVAAFDAATGARQWSAGTQPEENSSTNVGGGLGVAGGTVYATTGRGEMLALAAATGTVLWRAPLDAPARSAPTLANGLAYVTTLDGRALALRADTGARAWSYDAGGTQTGVLGGPAPAYADGAVVCGFGSGELVALRADSGALAWTDSLGAVRGRNSLLDLSAIRGLPLIEGNVVYAVSLGGVMLALDLRTGRRLWEHDIAGLHTPWLAGDWIFVLTTQQVLACLNKADGHVRWASPLQRYADMKKQQDPIFWTGPLLGGKYLYLGGSTAKLIAVNPATGAVVGEQDLPAPIAVAPVAAGGRMFVVTDDGALSAFG